MTPSLDLLRRLVTPPEEVGVERDWAAAQERLGLPLPQDYMDLVDVYGAGEFDDHLGLVVPSPTRNGNELVSYNKLHMENLTGLWAITKNRPVELQAADLRLLVWADTIDSDTVSWFVKPDLPPEKWPVVILDADLGQCEIHSTTCTEFLAGLFSGTIESDIITHHLYEADHEFVPFPVQGHY